MSSVTHTGPEGNGAIEPRAPFLHRGRHGGYGGDGREVRDMDDGVPGEQRYGPSGPPRTILTTPGITAPPLYYTVRYYTVRLLVNGVTE